MARAELDVGGLLLKLVGRETGEISKVDYTPQKPEFNHDSVIGETRFERATPESQGVSSAFFVDLLRTLNESKECKIHKFMALRHGKVIAECAFEPYEMDMWHVSFSMCKSIVSMAIGILVDDGVLSLDERISDIFSARISPFGFFRKSVTVKNLLTMSSGIEFAESGAVSGNDWRKSFLESGFKFDPGMQFDYNSMNTYMLSAIVTEKTGKSLFEFCKERIFNPMGIHRIYWESCPQSITKGGWGLFIRIEDMAKLGQLYLQNGKWDGKQILSRQWIVESTAWHMETGNDRDPHYGYQIWVNDDRPGSYAFNGVLGQSVRVYPDIDMVVVTNAGNNELMRDSLMAHIVRESMKKLEVSDTPLPENIGALNELKSVCKYASGRTKNFPVIFSGGWKNRKVSMSKGSTAKKDAVFLSKRADFWHAIHSFNLKNENQLILQWLTRLNGRTYDLDVKGVGLFPLMMQVVHNNFTDGIHRIGFRLCDDNSFFIDFYEGIEVYSLQCGFNGKRYTSTINMHGEKYEVSLVSYCKTDEYNRFVIRNEVVFLEDACMRTINICVLDDEATFIYPSVPSEIEVRLFETPGTEMLLSAIKTMTPDTLSGFQGKLVNKIYKGGIKEMFEQAVKSTLQPVIKGHLTEEPFEETDVEPVETLEISEENAENSPVHMEEKP
jgi:CubicO group peptidase (beta-lactamase class C family)